MVAKSGARQRSSLVGHTPATTQGVALYARVSTEDQAERETIDNQIDFLRRYADLHQLAVAGEYVDDGISGALPLGDRPEGQRMLQDAEAGRFGAVVFYKLSRLGRKLAVVVDAHDALARHGVTVRSGTESFDTSTPAGMMFFQLLASFAEYDRATIAENTSRGRDRVAKIGKWTGGPIPFGYDLDDKGLLIPSLRWIEQLGMTEADYVADLFARIARRETTINAEYQRLNALGVPREMRFGGEKRRVHVNPRGWQLSSLQQIVKNPLYKGEGSLNSRFGSVTVLAPALVDAATWDAAKVALLRNRNLATKNAKREYLLRGLIRCQNCGWGYAGAFHNGHRRYRCSGGTRAHPGPDGQPTRCIAKHLRADDLEVAVWDACREFIRNPGDAIAEAQRKLRERMAGAARFDAKRRATLEALAEKETERERILTLYRRGRIDEAEAEAQLDAIAKEAGHLREDLESMRAQAALLDASEAFLAESVALLAQLRGELAEIEATNDQTRKRAAIERYVRQITVETERVGPRKLQARVQVALRLNPAPIAIETSTRRRGGSASRFDGPAPGR